MPTNLPARKLPGGDTARRSISPPRALLLIAIIAMVLAWLLVGIDTGVLQPADQNVMLLWP